MDLLHLQYFAVVAEELNFRRAAERLRIAQPGLSQRIKTLERKLGVRLFNRDGRHVQLTSEGSELLHVVREALAGVDRIGEVARELKRGSTTSLALAYSQVVCSSTSFQLAADFRQQHPGIVVEIHAGNTSANVEDIRRGKIDVAFVCLPLDDDAELDYTVLAEEPIVVVVPSSHSLVGRRRIDRCDLRDEPLVFFPRHIAPGFHDLVLDRVYGQGVRPGAMAVEPDERYVLAAVAAGHSVTFLPRSAADLGGRGVVIRRLAHPEPTASVGIAWRRTNPNSALHTFLTFMRSHPGAGHGGSE